MKKRELIIILFLAFLISCHQKGNENSTKDVSSIILDEEIEDVKNNSDRTVYYRFPSPEDMLQYINREKIDYIPELLNPHENAKNYMGSESQAINLGVYISELAYVIMFKKLNQASNYLEAVNYLSDELFISPTDNSTLESRVKKNLNNIDSLKVISRDAYNDMVEYLVKTENEQTLALVSTGAYIEALNLAMNQIDKFDPKNPLVKKIFEQKYAFDNLYLYLKEHSDENNSDILAELGTIKSKFDQIKLIKTSKTKVTQEADGLLVFGGGETKIEITKDQFEDIKKTISQIREELIKNN